MWMPWIVVLAVALASAPEGPLESDLEEHALVESVVDWPFTVTPRKARFADRCRDLSEQAVTVEEDGVRVEVNGVDLGERRTVHMLLIDTSRSMADDRGVGRKRLPQTRRAARRYVRELVADVQRHPFDEVAVLTFDDDLILRAPRTPLGDGEGIERVLRRLDGIDGGFDTAFLDAVHQVVIQLRDEPERFVLIVLSDGEDNSSIVSREQVEQAIAKANPVTVFAIGLGLRDGPHRDLLKRVAEASGGRYYDVHAFSRPDYFRAALDKPFDDIRERLRFGHRISYLTAAPTDRERDRFVEVTLGSAVNDCRITGYKPRRYVGVRAPAPPPDPGGTPQVREGTLLVRVLDRIRDPGPLAVQADDGPELPRGYAIEERAVRVSVPDLPSALRSPPATAADVVEHWLRDGTLAWRRGTAGSDDTGGPGELFINGTSFLYHRGALARALFLGSDAYRAWVRSVLEPRVRSELRAALAEDPPAAAFEAAVRARLERPTTAELARHLAAWHDDVGVRDLGFQLERMWVDELIAGDGEAGLDRRRAQWKALAVLFRPPERVRIVVPLVLTWDPAREAFGFHRIVLPRLRSMPRANFPATPIALEIFARWIRDAGAGAVDGLREGWRVAGVRHEPLAWQEHAEAAAGEAPAIERPHRVSLDLASRDGGGVVRLELLVGVRGERVDAACRLDGGTGGPWHEAFPPCARP